MGAARYVGRVGGLAVALGVGLVVFTGHGVASADADTSTPASTSQNAGPCGACETQTPQDSSAVAASVDRGLGCECHRQSD